MTNDLFKGTGNDKILKDLLAVLRGFLAVLILFATITVDATIIEKYFASGFPQVSSVVLIGGFAIFVILLIGIAMISIALDKEDKDLKDNKVLSAFFFGLGIICVAVAIASVISLYSLYSKHILEITSLLIDYLSLIFANYLSLIIIGVLLQLHKEV
jgi:hypothetical protein